MFLQGADRPSGADSAKDARRAADLAQDARYRGDGDEASFREKDKRLIAFLPVLSVVLAIQTRGFKVIAPFADIEGSGAFSFDSGSCLGLSIVWWAVRVMQNSL